MADKEAKWYVIHTYSGYENKVKANIEKTVENSEKLKGRILEVIVPVEEVVERKSDAKKGKSSEKVTTRKILPGYVLIKMIQDDDTWYVVRNTRGVTGFVGPESSKPVPLTDEEMKLFLPDNGEKAKVVRKIDLQQGDMVILKGVWAGSEGVVDAVNDEKGTVDVFIEFMGAQRKTTVPYEDVTKK